MVKASKRFENDLSKLPDYLRDKAILWIELLETLGMREIRKRSGFHDEALKGKRRGERSVRLSRSYRLIYNELDGGREILLLEITKHEY